MRDELDQKLCAAYPKIFRDRSAPMTQTCMCWGFEHDDGWYNIIDRLCANIQGHIDWKQKQHERDVKYNEMIRSAMAGDLAPLEEYFSGNWRDADQRMSEALEKGTRAVTPTVPQVVVVQVKEKFGTLRFYYEGGDEYISGLVSMAEAMSGVTCETCGAPGQSRHGGWIRTLCDTHADEDI